MSAFAANTACDLKCGALRSPGQVWYQRPDLSGHTRRRISAGAHAVRQQGENGMDRRKLVLLVGAAIVVVVIGIVGYNWLAGGAGTPEDAQRLKDMGKMQDALAAYFKDNGAYPAQPASVGCPAPSNDLAGLASSLTPKYIDQIPHDPMPASCVYNYAYLSNGANYALVTRLDVYDTTKSADRWCLGAKGGPGPWPWPLPPPCT
jgi:hypothetical protein